MSHADDILDIASDRKLAGVSFALATVVRTVAATAAKAGAKAVILQDGTISEGWIGGGCARAAVLKAARDAIADGKSRLVSVQRRTCSTTKGTRPVRKKAACASPITCVRAREQWTSSPSRSCLGPRVVICGSSPVAVAVADLARRSGFAVTVCAPAAEQSSFADADRRMEGFALPVAVSACSSQHKDATMKRRWRRR